MEVNSCLYIFPGQDPESDGFHTSSFAQTRDSSSLPINWMQNIATMSVRRIARAYKHVAPANRHTGVPQIAPITTRSHLTGMAGTNARKPTLMLLSEVSRLRANYHHFGSRFGANETS